MGWKPPCCAEALGQPVPSLFWRSGGRQMALPSSRVVPVNTCPVLRPRWCPAGSPYRLQVCCLPLFRQRRLIHDNLLFRGSIARPMSLFHPVSHFHYWFYAWISLLTGWLGFSQMGLELCRVLGSHPLDNFDKFQGFCYSVPAFSFPNVSDFLGTTESKVNVSSG
jgi:hypothetical protein